MHAGNRVTKVMHKKRHDQIWLNNSVRKSLFLGRKSRPLYCSYSKLKSGKSVLIYIQQDATLHSLFYLKTALHVPGVTATHHQERKQLYLQHLVFVTPSLLPVAIATGSNKGVTNTNMYINM
jgi:hypothetical protein